MASRVDISAAKAAHPNVRIDDAVFARWVEERSKSGDADALHLSDLYLACACAHGDAGALGELEKKLLPKTVPAIQRIRSNPQFVDDALQALRDKLLVAEAGAEPKIATYTGKGPLLAWLRTVAIGTALNVLRARRAGEKTAERADEEDALLGLDEQGSSRDDVDLALIKSRYKKQFNESFRHAWSLLTPQDRTVLRMRFLDGLTTEQIGEVYRVHRTTVMRWLEKSQASLLTETKSALAQKLKLTLSDVDSLVGVLKAGLNESIVSILKKTTE